MKKVIIIFFVFCPSLMLMGQITKHYDEKMTKLLENKDWFDAIDYYNGNKDKLSEYMQLVARGTLKSYTNEPESALEALSELIEKYSDTLDYTILEYKKMMIDNYDLIQDNRAIISIHSEMLDSTNNFYSKHIADNALGIFKNNIDYLSTKPITSVIWENGVDSTILPIDTLSNAVIFNSTINDKVNRFLFDTGAGMSLITKKKAKELGLKTLSLDEGGDFAIIDTMQIGDLKICNALFLIRTSIVYDSLYDLGFDIVFGLDLIRQLKKVEFSFEDMEIIVHKNVDKIKSQNPNMLFSTFNKYNILYLGLEIDGNKEVFFYDTGGIGVDILIDDDTDVFREFDYNKLQLDTFRIMGNNDILIEEMYVADDFEYKLLEESGSYSQVVHFLNLGNKSFGSSYSVGDFGEIGMVNSNFFANFSKVSLDFVNMRLSGEGL